MPCCLDSSRGPFRPPGSAGACRASSGAHRRAPFADSDGDGSQTRSLCYVSDLIGGIYKLLLSDINTPINIGNPEEVTVLELAEMIRRLSRSKSKIIRKPLPVDDPKQRCPDIRLARKLLRWSPKVGLEAGLKRTLAYFQATL